MVGILFMAARMRSACSWVFTTRERICPDAWQELKSMASTKACRAELGPLESPTKWGVALAEAVANVLDAGSPPLQRLSSLHLSWRSSGMAWS